MFRSPLSLDRTNRISTVVVCALAGFGVLAMLSSDIMQAHVGAAALTAILAIAFAMSPRGLTVDAGEVRIERRLWPPLRITRSEIERASPIDSLGIRVIKVGGAGGLFGSFGLFSSAELGRFRLYATRRGQAVLITRRGSLLPIVVTPDDVAGAIEAIDTRPRLGAYRQDDSPT
jgi:hypothetical protein